MTETDQQGECAQNTVLVTGGTGFIGSHLVDHLIGRDHRVYVIDDLSTSTTEYLNASAEFIDLDVCSPDLNRVVASISPQSIYHLAAQGSVSVSAKEPLLDERINLYGSLNLLEAARGLCHTPRIVYFSTGGAIYGEVPASALPAKESMVAKPMSPYGASKLAVENYLRVYGHLYGTNYGIVRPANVYGPRQNPHGEAGVIAIFTQAMLLGREVTIFGDGNDQRDYIYASDFIEGVIAIADANLPGPYNIGSGYGVSVNEIYQHLADLIPTNMPARYGAPRAGDISKIWLDVSAAKNDLGWGSKTTFEEGIRQTVEWFRQTVS